MKSMPRPNDAIVTRAIQAAGADPTAFAAFRDELFSKLAEMAANEPPRARTWLNAVKLIGEADELNMDPEQAAAKLISGLLSASVRH
jgi:DNA polymerase-3 subunit delta'